MSQPLHVAHHQVSFFITQVHSPTLAIAEHLAGGTITFLHPIAVAVILETILPHIPEVVFVNISLIVFATNAGAS